MRLTPRADEVKRVVAVLESDEFDSADKMAKAIIKTVAELLDMRDWYALGHRFAPGEVPVAWGPYASESDALKMAAKVGLSGEWTTKLLHSPGTLLGNVEGVEPGTKDYCLTCGHADFFHLFEASSRGRCGLQTTCDCPKYKRK